MDIIKLNQIHKDAVIPRKGTQEDACYDVVATSIRFTKKYIEYGLGFSSEMPPGIKGVVVPRSSISDTDLLMCNSPGQIDNKYPGEWKVRFKYVGNKTLSVPEDSTDDVKNMIASGYDIYQVGDRVAQISFEKENEVHINFEDNEGNTHISVPIKSSREEGFGHTGR